MAISFKKYVDITSGVGGATLVQRRDLIGRLFITNELLPPSAFIEFTSAEQVGEYFGTTSEEYLRSVAYFAFISKNITRAQKISFARWVDADVAPMIFGTKFTTTLAEFQAIVDGSFTLNISPDSNVISGLNFSTALSFADVATLIEAGINAQVGTMWTAATVTYNAVSGGFDFVGGDAVAATISAAPGGVGTELLALIGWLPDAIFADGALTQSVTDALTESADASDNFGSFLFLPTLTITEIVEAATWNDLQNFKYMYTVPVLKIDAQSYYDDLNGIGGVGITISETAGEYPEQDPMVVFAATNYEAENSVQNFMFQIFDAQTASVTTTLESDQFDAIRTNYYGRTQTAGQFIEFYQRGLLMGGATDALDINTYANEIWLKDANGAAIMNLLLSLARVSANAQGKVQLITVLQGVVDQALENGTISVGKTLNDIQKLFIGEKSGDPDAWYQVQNIGYWLDVEIEQDGIEFKAVYVLIYSKDDVIRKVEGAQVLI